MKQIPCLLLLLFSPAFAQEGNDLLSNNALKTIASSESSEKSKPERKKSAKTTPEANAAKEAKKAARVADTSEVVQPADIHIAKDFKVELIHTVDNKTEGSWVSLTVDDKGRIIASDQYGGLYRMTPSPLGSNNPSTVEKLDVNIKGAHGLLYAFDSLYVMVNEKPEKPGLYRLRDTKGTGQFDEKTFLREINGQGEHGNHSLTLSPDGKSIYIACGNHSGQPVLEHTRLSRPFADDQVIPRINKGNTFSETQPHAFTCKVSPDGKRFEMISAGMRNHFDIAFNSSGDLFTYDSDMEWDSGTPWYRPTRIYQIVSGGDYGFRESSGKLLEYCPDVVPPLVNVGPGSPTGMVSGQNAAFPAKYQKAIFACDWTYGTLYAIHLTPKGAGYDAKLEEFITAKPLPLTDVVIGKDRAMYFSTGGRRTQSAVYRVTYIGKESTATAPTPPETPEHKLRIELERLHDEGTGPEAIEKAWPYLNHPDRLVRYAARVAIERQPAKLWAQRVLKETQPWSVIESSLALARMGGEERRNDVVALLNQQNFGKLSLPQQLAMIRVYQVAIARSGLPTNKALADTIARLDSIYPASTNDLNRELSRTLVALGAPNAVPKTLKLMASAKDDEVTWLSAEKMSRNNRYGPKFLTKGKSQPNQQQIAYAYALRSAKTGWTSDLRRTYFSWFATTAPWEGGNQFRGFISQILKDSLENVTDPEEKQIMMQLASSKAVATPTAPIVPPHGPGKAYQVEDVIAIAKEGMKQRDFNRGRELFTAAACQSCHRFGNEGGGLGPDLSSAGSRYTLHDLVENIIEPNKVISDQYESTIITKKSGDVIIGRIVSEDDDKLEVATNPFDLSAVTEVKIAELKSRSTSPTSLMPPGLINGMNPSEVMDLMAYVLSGGDKKNDMFHK